METWTLLRSREADRTLRCSRFRNRHPCKTCKLQTTLFGPTTNPKIHILSGSNIRVVNPDAVLGVHSRVVGRRFESSSESFPSEKLPRREPDLLLLLCRATAELPIPRVLHHDLLALCVRLAGGRLMDSNERRDPARIRCIGGAFVPLPSRCGVSTLTSNDEQATQEPRRISWVHCLARSPATFPGFLALTSTSMR